MKFTFYQNIFVAYYFTSSFYTVVLALNSVKLEGLKIPLFLVMFLFHATLFSIDTPSFDFNVDFKVV